MKRIYGPVPSRRFGLSLGIDPIPFKRCPLNCIYCQLGEHDSPTLQQAPFFTVDEILHDVEDAIETGPTPDVLTLAGSGEPGLYSLLGHLIDALKTTFHIPVLLITNGVLLTDPAVRAAALKSDIFAPSLDAGDNDTFQRINLPHPDIVFDDVVNAIIETTNAHKGVVRLEVMLVNGVNDSEESLHRIKAITDRIACSQIDLNTPVRPPIPERGAMPCDAETLQRAQRILGKRAIPIANFARRTPSPSTHHQFNDLDKTVKETVTRRPLTMSDIQDSLNLSEKTTRGILNKLLTAGLIVQDLHSTGTYYRSVSFDDHSTSTDKHNVT